MVRCVLALFALLCGTQLALSQDPDCSTEAGRLAFLTESAKTDSDCYTPLFKLASSDDDYDISTKDVEAVSILQFKRTITNPIYNTVKPPNNGRIAGSPVVPSREVILFSSFSLKPIKILKQDNNKTRLRNIPAVNMTIRYLIKP